MHQQVRGLGGIVTTEGRVMGVLSVARALGDFQLAPCVSAQPDINLYLLNLFPHTRTSAPYNTVLDAVHVHAQMTMPHWYGLRRGLGPGSKGSRGGVGMRKGGGTVVKGGPATTRVLCRGPPGSDLVPTSAKDPPAPSRGGPDPRQRSRLVYDVFLIFGVRWAVGCGF